MIVAHSFFYSSSSIDIDPYVHSHGSPPWLPITFNLTYELPQFAIYFQVNVLLILHRLFYSLIYF